MTTLQTFPWHLLHLTVPLATYEGIIVYLLTSGLLVLSRLSHLGVCVCVCVAVVHCAFDLWLSSDKRC